MDIIFVDKDQDHVERLKQAFEGNDCVRAMVGEMSEVPIENTAFLFPCNAFLSMAYSEVGRIYDRVMFPHVQIACADRLNRLGVLDVSLGIPALPIGAAMIVEAVPHLNSYIVCAPTTFYEDQERYYPQNIYHAFFATLGVLRKFRDDKIKRLVCPRMFRGCRTEVEQVGSAYDDFMCMTDLQRFAHQAFHRETPYIFVRTIFQSNYTGE